MKCKECGTVLKEGALYCQECGAKAASPERCCPKCGAGIAGGEKFCSVCGEKIPVKIEAGLPFDDRNRFSGNGIGDGAGRKAGEGMQFEYHREEESHENMNRLARFLKVCEVSEQFDWERAGIQPAKYEKSSKDTSSENDDNPISLALQVSLLGMGITVLISLAALVLHKQLALYLSIVQIILQVAAVLLHEDAGRIRKKWIPAALFAGAAILSILNIGILLA